MICGETLHFLVPPMKHRPRPPEQDDLLRPRLVDMIDARHELVKLSATAKAMAPLILHVPT